MHKLQPPPSFLGCALLWALPLWSMHIEQSCRASMPSWWHSSFSVIKDKFFPEALQLGAITRVLCARHSNSMNMSLAPTITWILSELSLLSIFTLESSYPSSMSLDTRMHLLGLMTSQYSHGSMCGQMPWQKRTPPDSSLATMPTNQGFFTGGMMVCQIINRENHGWSTLGSC